MQAKPTGRRPIQPRSGLPANAGVTAPAVYRPASAGVTAPPVYRPNIAAQLQPKPPSGSPAVYRHTSTGVTAPAVYRPKVAALLQQKPGVGLAVIKRPHVAAPVSRRGIGEPLRAPGPQISRQPIPRVNVVQKMEWFGNVAKGIKQVGMAITHSKPNPFEMEGFTSCVCFVFNVAGKTVEQFTEGFLYKSIFDSIKSTWASRKTKAPFYALCPYREDGGFTDEWRELYSKTDFGDRPLIVVIGHCSPGSNVIQNDAHDKEYSITQVINALTPVMKEYCTIYLTPCNTGVASSTSASFQNQFTTELSTNTHPGMGYFTIGTTSTTVPLFGKVWTADQTYTYKQKPLTAEEYLLGQ